MSSTERARSRIHGKRSRFWRWRSFGALAVVLALRCRIFTRDLTRPLIDSSSVRSFRRGLRRLDLPVPLRTKGRTTQEAERASVVRLLTAIEKDIVPPVRLTQRERPDFALSVGGRQVGIEHTEAIHQNEAHSTALREQGHGPPVNFVARRRTADATASRRELLQQIADDEAGDGWAGNSAEEEWAEAMFASIERKLAAAKKPGFERFLENWLLVYDNWPLPHIDVTVAGRQLQELLGASVFDTFDAIYVVNDQSCWKFTKAGLTVERITRPARPPLPRWPRFRKRPR